MRGDYSKYRQFNKDKPYSKLNKQQGRVDLDWEFNEQNEINLHYDRTSLIDIIGQTGAPDENSGFEIDVIDPSKDDFTISAGRYYVDGILCENTNIVTASKQPNLPNDSKNSNPALPKGNSGKYLVYLDVWEREITAIDNPEIRETALNGADTATRTQIIWQVKTTNIGNDCSCLSQDELRKQIQPKDAGQMRARVVPSDVVEKPCALPPDSQYMGLQNHLYRIEINKPGSDGTATFKWSRNNGSIAAHSSQIIGDNIVIDDEGGHTLLGFTNDIRYIEVTDERHELWGLPGVIVPLDHVEGKNLVVSSSNMSKITSSDLDQSNLKIIAWDGVDSTVSPAWMKIENGIEIQFQKGYFYQTGDFWTIPARVGNGIEWPLDSSNIEQFCLPQGIIHHYASLAVLNYNRDDEQPNFTGPVTDCRVIFPSLDDLDSLFYVSGDTQMGQPGNPLPFPLIVGAARGKIPLEGITVKFHFTSPYDDSSLKSIDGGTYDPASHTFTTTTDAQGLAQVQWVLGTSEPPTVQAVMYDEKGPIHLPVIFSARIDTSGQGSCSFTASPTDDLSKIIRKLDKNLGGKICLRPGIFHIREPIEITGHSNIVIQGAGPSTRLEGDGLKNLFIFRNCKNISFDRIYAKSYNYRIEKDAKQKVDVNKFVDQFSTILGQLQIKDLPQTTKSDISVITTKYFAGQNIDDAKTQIKNIFQNPELKKIGVSKDNLVKIQDAFMKNLIETKKQFLVVRPIVKQNTKGVLHFDNCKEISVTNSTIMCGRGNISERSCLSFYGTEESPTSQIYVHDCNLFVSSLQTGILVINGKDVVIRNNRLEVKPFVGKKTDIRKKDLSKKRWFKTIVTALMQNMYARRLQPNGIKTNQDVMYYYRTLAYAAFVGVWKYSMFGKNGGLFSKAEKDLILKLRRDMEIGFQGVVFGGSSGGNLKIHDNIVRGMVQGIHMGASVQDSTTVSFKSFDSILICDNHIDVVYPIWFPEQKHGIFVGNAYNINIKDNDITIRELNNISISLPSSQSSSILAGKSSGNSTPNVILDKLSKPDEKSSEIPSKPMTGANAGLLTFENQDYLWNRPTYPMAKCFDMGIESLPDFASFRNFSNSICGGRFELSMASTIGQNSSTSKPVISPTVEKMAISSLSPRLQKIIKYAESEWVSPKINAFQPLSNAVGIKVRGAMEYKVIISTNTIFYLTNSYPDSVTGIMLLLVELPRAGPEPLHLMMIRENYLTQNISHHYAYNSDYVILLNNVPSS